MRDVFVSGVGAVTCLGNDLPTTWASLIGGGRGIRPVPALTAAGCRTGFAGTAEGFATPSGFADHDRSTQMAVTATAEALADAGFTSSDIEQSGPRMAAVIGSSKGGVSLFCSMHAEWLAQRNATDPDLLSRLWLRVIPNAMVDAVARYFGIGGRRDCPVAACATGAVAFVAAARLIEQGQADVAICGAADASIHPLWIAAFDRMGVLARPHARDGPAGACRPFDVDRTGFAVSEGAGILVLESASSLQRRRAEPIARVAGHRLAADAVHLTAGDPDAGALTAAIRTAVSWAAASGRPIDAICAHGTGTLANDAAESRAFASAFGARHSVPPVFAAKGALGHALGAAGAIELAICAQTLRKAMLPPSVNYSAPAKDTIGLRLQSAAQPMPLNNMLKVAMGFGGHIAVILLAAP